MDEKVPVPSPHAHGWEVTMPRLTRYEHNPTYRVELSGSEAHLIGIALEHYRDMIKVNPEYKPGCRAESSVRELLDWFDGMLADPDNWE
jgi:hypothetical protein